MERREYNRRRPHSSPGYRSPALEARMPVIVNLKRGNLLKDTKGLSLSLKKRPPMLKLLIKQIIRKMAWAAEKKAIIQQGFFIKDINQPTYIGELS
ncbi:MAG: hypothetical protein PHY29_09235 [Syntrophales bacterium]|nr:hypothetical protein [Syntrophales bacterium]